MSIVTHGITPEQAMTELEGATIVPHARAENATEFAAIWNNRTPEQREDIFQNILAASETAFKCHTEHRPSWH